MAHIDWDVLQEVESYMRRNHKPDPIYPTCDNCGVEMEEIQLVYVDGNDTYCLKCAAKIVGEDIDNLDVENLKYAYELTDYDN